MTRSDTPSDAAVQEEYCRAVVAHQLGRIADALERLAPAAGSTEPAAKLPLPSLTELADTLYREFGPQRVGRPAAAAVLRRVHGSCSAERSVLAKDIHNGRVALERDSADDAEERSA